MLAHDATGTPCSKIIFDAIESVAKEKFGMPHATFGQVVAHIARGKP